MIKRIGVIILVLLVTVLLMPSSQFLLNRGGLKASVSSSEWAVGESILAKIDYGKLILPTNYIISKGEYLDGNIISLYQNDSNYLLIKVNDISEFEMYLWISAKGEGWLNLYACYDAYSASSNAVLVPDFIRLNVSVYNTKSMAFDYFGLANGTGFWISNTYITGDDKMIVKISGFGESDSSMYFVARISYVYFKLAPEIISLETEYTYVSDSIIIHKLRLEMNYDNGVVQFINISKWWRYLYSDPEVQWFYPNKTIRTQHKGTYTVFFSSSDTWDYPWKRISKIIFIDSRGNFIPFEMFDVYVRSITKKLDRVESFRFMRNITIQNPLNFTVYYYPIRLELNETNFNFLAVNPNLSDIFFGFRGSEKQSQEYYLEYWDGRKAIFWIKPSVIRNGTQNLKLLYGSDYNTTESSPDAKSLYVIKNDFKDPSELNSWETSDSDWIIYTVIDPTDDTLYHPDSTSESYILSRKNFSAIVSIQTSLSAFDFSSSKNEIFIGTYLVYRGSNNYVALEVKKNASGGFLTLYQRDNEKVYTTQNSTLRIDFIDSLWRVDLNGFINFLNDSLWLQTTLYTSTSSYKYILTLNLSNLIDAGRMGYYCANTSLGVDFDYLEYQNLTKLLNQIIGVRDIGEEMINYEFLKFSYYVTPYQRLFSNYLDASTSGLINIVAKDVFGAIIANITTSAKETIVIPIEVYSFKIKNNRDDTFVHITLRKKDGILNWSEWLAPEECAEYILPNDKYNLQIDYTGGAQQSAEIDFILNRDVYFMINGTVIGDILLELQKVNSTILNSIQNINLYINTLNSSLENVSVNLQVSINNVNSTISQLLTRINLGINNTYSSINNSLDELKLRISNVNSLINELDLSMSNELNSLNSSIESVYLDMRNNFSIIHTKLNYLELNMSSNMSLMNTTIYKLISNVTHTLLSVNASIGSIFINLRSNIIELNTTLGGIVLNLSSKLVLINSSINTVLQTVISELELYNSTLISLLHNISEILNFEKSEVFSTVLDIRDKILFMNSSLWNISIDLRDYIISFNTTFNNMLANISNGILLLNSKINFLNETILVNLYDMQLNLSKSIILSLNDIDNLTKYLFSLVNIFKITMMNSFTGEIIKDPLIRVYVNGSLVTDRRIATIGDYLDIEIKDFWDRVLWSNITNERDIRIFLDFGKLLILNEYDYSASVYISPINSSKILQLIIPPLDAYQLYLYCYSRYNITIKIGDSLYLNGTYGFGSMQNGEPVILIKIEKVNVVSVSKSSFDLINIALGLFSGIGISTISLGIYRYFFSRRYVIRAEELLRRLISNDQALELLSSQRDELEDQ